MDQPRSDQSRPLFSSGQVRACGEMALALMCLLCGSPTLVRSQGTTKVLETEIQRYQDQVTASGKIPSDEQGLIASYIGVSETWGHISACADDSCPDLILFDRPLGQHRNLSFNTIGHVTAFAANTPEDKSPAIVKWTEESHGAAMAGIIAAKRTGSGLLGVNPEIGLFSVDWPYYSEDKLSDLTKELETMLIARPKHQKVFVVATGWTSDPSFSFQSCEERLRRDNLANFLVSQARPLVIVAAGNDQKTGGRDIVRSSNRTPQNLGDCQNVLVVTACDKCNTPSPQIPTWANYSSEGLVHIAAFGGDVLTTSPNDRLTVMPGGTSPATAFVAGVASAMIAKWPGTYLTYAYLVKTRLQITSTPSLEGIEAEKVASGILNADLAFKDPDQDYVSTKTQKNAVVPVEGWCVDQIVISKNGGTANRVIPVKDIHRLYCGEPGRCVVYHADEAQRFAGMVVRSGPGRIHSNMVLQPTERSSVPAFTEAATSSQTEQERPLFRAGGNLYRDGDFTDILLHVPKGPTSRGNCMPIPSGVP